MTTDRDLSLRAIAVRMTAGILVLCCAVRNSEISQEDLQLESAATCMAAVFALFLWLLTHSNHRGKIACSLAQSLHSASVRLHRHNLQTISACVCAPFGGYLAMSC